MLTIHINIREPCTIIIQLVCQLGKLRFYTIKILNMVCMQTNELLMHSRVNNYATKMLSVQYFDSWLQDYMVF